MAKQKSGYEKVKEDARQRNKALSLAGRDIHPLPKVKNRKRRNSCSRDFRRFCETYYSEVFNLEWSSDHLTVIRKIEDSVLNGGLFAIAMPRGSGKTSLAICAAEWALIYGHRSFVVLIGASETAAVELLEQIKSDLETNELLAADFPEVCYPIRCLDGIVHRAAGQLLKGERTNIGWTQNELVLPTVCKAATSGARVKVAGITGRIRGLSVKQGGKTIRPDFVLIDDPQTDESAASPVQVKKRLAVVSGAVLGLAGPKKKIAGVMPVTVISKGDVADQLLDQKQHPAWRGERLRMLRSLPTNLKLWEQYAELRATSLRADRGLADATAFYLDNRAALDAGAEAAWSARFNGDEASAIQHAMNLKLANEEAFFAEYQNEPVQQSVESEIVLAPDQIIAKKTALPRFHVPDYGTKVTGFIDVQGSILYYCVVAWSDEFTGHVIDYGTYPKQSRGHFFLREVSPTLAAATGKSGLESQLYEGLRVLTTDLLAKQWPRYGTGEPVRMSRLLIDSGYQDSVVKQFCKESQYAALLLPSQGVGITADRKPMNEYERRVGERLGWNWQLTTKNGSLLRYDTNSWKTFMAERLKASPGDRGNLSLFEATDIQHRMFAEHVTSEIGTPTEGLGRIVNVWRMRPGRENHLLDCLVGAAVAASEQGVLFVGHDSGKANARKRRKVDVRF